jgi:beta-apo-4'-carotenal oxygenase
LVNYPRLRDHEAEIQEACMKDLGKGYYEAMLSEIKWVENDIIFVCNNLEKWAKDEKAPDIDFVNSLMSPRIRKDPLGCVLVIG